MASEILTTVQDYLRADGLTEVMAFLRENRWYVAGTAVVGGVLWWAVRRPRNLPPGPRGWPLLGAVGDIGEDMHLDCIRLGEKYGDMISLMLLGKLVLVLNGKEVIKEALVNQSENFSDRPDNNMVKIMDIEDEIFGVPYTDKFRATKKAALTLLREYGWGTARGEKAMMVEIDKINAIICRHNAEPFDPMVLFKKAVTSMMMSMTMGVAVDTYESAELVTFIDVFEKWAATMYDPNAMFLDLFPLWMTKMLFGKICTNLEAQTANLMTVLLGYVNAHINTFDPDNPRDYIDGYMKEHGVNNINPRTLAANFIAFSSDAIITFHNVIAGLFLYLAKYPDMQRRVQAQINDVIGSGRQVSMKDKASLPLVEALIYETFRMVTPAAIFPPHEVARDTTLGGYHIPKGTAVFVNAYAVHMSPKNFDDPEHFRLENFLDEDGSFKLSDAWMPFGIGRRMCMGEMLIKMETFLLTANLLQKFNLRFGPGFSPGESDLHCKGLLRKFPAFDVSFTER